LDTFVRRLLPAAEANSLALLALKCLAPGVPDFYQGAEDWLITLTDPDNRRPVAFDGLSDRLFGAGGAEGSPARTEKLRLTHELLALRRRAPALFSAGDYQPVTVEGPAEGHVFAFSRSHDAERLLVAVRRLGARMHSAGLREALAASSLATTGEWYDWLNGGNAGANVLEALALEPVLVLTGFPRESR
jgi:(1->4)-alpha-D-glucan 1-alpha-D-glucosylmutase